MNSERYVQLSSWAGVPSHGVRQRARADLERMGRIG